MENNDQIYDEERELIAIEDYSQKLVNYLNIGSSL